MGFPILDYSLHNFVEFFYVAALNTKKTDGVKLKQMNSGKKDGFLSKKKQESFYFFTLSLNSDRSLPKGEKQKIN